MKVLLTFTGFNDPYSKSVVAGEERTGPILSLLAARKFDRVILFSTPSTLALTDETAAAITDAEVTVIRLNLPDPTDYLAILRELRRECGAIRDQDLNAELFVATASGTPQMHSCWFLLTASGELPATLLHVRPPRFVTKDLPQVEEIISSAGEFPRVLPQLLISGDSNPPGLLDSALESVGLVVEHSSMRKLVEKSANVAPYDATVLILGETGTGKDLFANLIHILSRRRGKFVALNCGAIPNELVESTLFGHVKGSFTGAVSNQPGKFEEANEGTLLLDEIGELPLSSQVKLLRVLQDQLVQPIGAPTARKVDVRIIAATNLNLADEVKAKRFREDLFYRLNPITLTIPPLRERRPEIILIAAYLLERLNRTNRRQRRLSPGALRKLSAYSWPGNVRQLEGVLTRAVILVDNDLIDGDDLELSAISSSYQLPEPAEDFDLKFFLADAHDKLINRALVMANGNQAAAARLLNMSAQNVQQFAKAQMAAGKSVTRKPSARKKAKSNNRKPKSHGEGNPSRQAP
jgi:transcriptional regulator with AAA-type ATPase domain